MRTIYLQKEECSYKVLDTRLCSD